MGRAQGGPDRLLAVADDQGRLADARRREPVEEAREQAAPAQVQEPLGALVGERREPLANAGGEDEPRHGLAFAFSASSKTSSSCLVLSFFTSSAQPDCWMIRLNWVR